MTDGLAEIRARHAAARDERGDGTVAWVKYDMSPSKAIALEHYTGDVGALLSALDDAHLETKRLHALCREALEVAEGAMSWAERERRRHEVIEELARIDGRTVGSAKERA